MESLEQTLNAVGLGGAAGIWATAWEESGAALPEGELFFLQRDWISATLGELAMPEEIIDAFHQGLDMFHKHPALRRLAWHCHHLLQSGIDKETHLKQWPTLPDLHSMAGMFYAYVVLAGLPTAWRRHRERGIDAAITRETFSDLALWMQDYRGKHGRWGVSQLHETGWLQDHLEARLFRLGRLQFRLESFSGELRVYREDENKRPVMLADTGQTFRPDGRYEGVNGIRAGAASWRSTLEVRDEAVAGQAVDARGFARPATVTLCHPGGPLLRQHDRVIGIHIPAGGSLTLDACGESLRQADEFFPRHFPEYLWRVFTCHTWLFDAQFEDYLSPTSNIVRFLRQFYLYPLPDGDDRQTLERVCGRVYAGPEDMPRDTSLQRVVARHMERGGRWYKTGGFLLRDDLTHWGSDYYRG